MLPLKTARNGAHGENIVCWLVVYENRGRGKPVKTVADALNMEWEGKQPPGASLFADQLEERLLFHACRNESAAAMRQGGYKYIYGYDRRPMRVFDTAEDPGERHDIAGELPSGQILAAEARMVGWLRNVRQAYALVKQTSHPVE